MVLKLYNTLGREKQEFVPIKGKTVKMYTCGPTVYWYQHIGNLRSYIFSDILRRVLEYNKFKVKQVMNVTDVGHLTSDADEGEDKMEKAAEKEGKKAKDIANYYLDVFKQDFKKLNISEPDIWCKATKHIKEQIELVKTLEEKGYTYQTSDGIYFDTSKLRDYGKLALLNTALLQAGKRVSMGEKKNKTDFALWKFSEQPGVRQQEWKSPWGIGFPGWHIECSAMSSKYLGKQFDIHTGGEDHIAVHHTNEIAQSEAAFGKMPWVKYWLHGAFLTFDGEKMSKSSGKIATIAELESQGFRPLHYRYFILTGHYKKQMSFTNENLENAKNSYQRLKNIIKELKDDKKENKEYLKKFENAINNDLNMPEALQVLWEMIRDTKAKGKIKTIKKMDEVFGLDLLKQEKLDIPEEVKELAEKRQLARKNKNWEESDKLRDEIKELGYQVNDTPGGWKITKL
ncbi:cysteine--tRNA ligase [Candidatus Pacearchaeota archaeon]|nr:cysteine--tRNA ligase [Candidatus Pacearchaeota archaeon]